MSFWSGRSAMRIRWFLGLAMMGMPSMRWRRGGGGRESKGFLRAGGSCELGRFIGGGLKVV